MVRQNVLHIIHIHAFVELLPDTGIGLAGYPDLEFGVQLKRARGLYTESGDAFIGDGQVLHLAARKALVVYQNEAFGGEDEGVS